MIAEDKKCSLTDTNCAKTRDAYAKITAQGYCLTDEGNLHNINGWAACAPARLTATGAASNVNAPNSTPDQVTAQPLELYSSTCSDLPLVEQASTMPFSGNTHITHIVRVDGDGNQCQIECVGGDQDDPDLRLSKCAQLVDAKLKQGYPAQTALVQNITPPALVPEVDESATVTPNPFEPIPSAKEFGYWCLGIGVILFILGSGKPDRRYSSGVRGGIPILLSLGSLLVVVGLIFMFFPVELIIVIVLTIVFGKAYTRNRDVRRLREENEFRLAQALSLVDDHREELTIRRRQLTITKSFNLVDESKWVDEQKLFINELIFQRLGSLSDEILTNVLTHINDVTSDFDSEEDKYHDKMDGVDYERFVAHKLDGLGWTTRLTKGSGDQGIDVIARKQSTTVVIQCKRLSNSVGNGAVQEVIAGKIFERADYAAVVSNARFSNSAKQLASATGTLLLHHNELTRLDILVNKP